MVGFFLRELEAIDIQKLIQLAPVQYVHRLPGPQPLGHFIHHLDIAFFPPDIGKFVPIDGNALGPAQRLSFLHNAFMPVDHRSKGIEDDDSNI